MDFGDVVYFFAYTDYLGPEHPGSIKVYQQRVVSLKDGKVRLSGGARLKSSNVHATWEAARKQALDLLHAKQAELLSGLDDVRSEIARVGELKDDLPKLP